jgi:adenylate cyclase
MPAVNTPKKSTALIVDDNYYNRDLCALALKHIGYDVLEAHNGVEALSILADRTFDLLVVDLQMPEMDGATVIRQIRKQSLHHNMTVIVITANYHMATDEVDLSADYVMYKPIDIDEFAQFARGLAAFKKDSR